MMFLNYICLYAKELTGWKYEDNIDIALVFPFYLLFNVILYYPISQIILRLPCYKCLPMDTEDKIYYKCSKYDYKNKMNLRFWEVRNIRYKAKDLKHLKNWKKHYKV